MKPKYNSAIDVALAIKENVMSKATVSRMVNYYKNKGYYKRAKMFKLGLVEYEYMDLISEDDQEEN